MSCRRDDCTACSHGVTKLYSHRGSATFQPYSRTQLCSQRDRAISYAYQPVRPGRDCDANRRGSVSERAPGKGSLSRGCRRVGES